MSPSSSRRYSSALSQGVLNGVPYFFSPMSKRSLTNVRTGVGSHQEAFNTSRVVWLVVGASHGGDEGVSLIYYPLPQRRSAAS